MKNPDIMPIRIQAGAFSPGLPANDLTLSPLHALYLNHVLIPAKALVNQTTIVQLRDVPVVEYYHLELLTHDVIFAEGMEAETYLDDANRTMFHNAAEFAALYPDAVQTPSRYCAPRLEHGAEVEAARLCLAERAAALGHAPAIVHTVTMEMAGVVRAVIPAGVTELRLRSGFGYAEGDRRPLGALICGISIDGTPLPLRDPRLVRGFHPAETHGPNTVRWTNGEATLVLPPTVGSCVVDIDVGALMDLRLAS
jgi:hypothetical protein